MDLKGTDSYDRPPIKPELKPGRELGYEPFAARAFSGDLKRFSSPRIGPKPQFDSLARILPIHFHCRFYVLVTAKLLERDRRIERRTRLEAAPSL